MAGAIAYISKDTDGVHWKKIFEPELGPIDFRTLKAGLGNTDDIEVALAWKPAPGLLATFKNLKMIVSLGMGVDHLLTDDKLPKNVASGTSTGVPEMTAMPPARASGREVRPSPSSTPAAHAL